MPLLTRVFTTTRCLACAEASINACLAEPQSGGLISAFGRGAPFDGFGRYEGVPPTTAGRVSK